MESVQISRSMRFAAHARQIQLEGLQAQGVGSYSDDIERRAISSARYWESFAECYPVELVEAGTALVAMFGTVRTLGEGGAAQVAALVVSAEYLAAVQACADLEQVQR